MTSHSYALLNTADRVARLVIDGVAVLLLFALEV